MTKPLSLEEFERAVTVCISCKECVHGNPPDYPIICPAYKKFRALAYSPAGKVHLARALLGGMVDYSEELLDVVYKCTLCKACMEFCEDMYLRVPELGLGNLIETLRADLVEKGYGPLPSQARFGESTKKNKNPYREDHDKRFAWLPKKARANPKGEADLIFYVGCTASYRRQRLARSLFNILERAGVSFAILGGEEWCCGSPLIRTGQLDIAKIMAKHNAEAIKATGAKRVVVICAGCYSTLKKDYPELDADVGAEIIHANELLLELVEQGKLKLKDFNETVTYHDSCHYSREFGLYDIPRKLIQMVPGVKLVEMVRSREQGWCCGAGGGVRAGYPEWSIEIARDRIQEAAQTEATTLITSCSFCNYNLHEGIKASGQNIKLQDIVEFIECAMK